ncbi:MAG: amino acid ABC transporter ATP-binding protein [Lachnospiraceae bacterium]|nr:amino acid ABC transporter ATP-binding protein [Lachnospiraceae bacterium]
MLRVEHLHKEFDGYTVLDDVSLTVNAGEVVVIVGPSGCGKSTFLRCLNGLEKIEDGKVLLDGKVINPVSENIVKERQKIGMVFQSYDLFPHKTILQNIILAPMKVQKRNREEAVSEAISLLDRVGLSNKKDQYPRQLSGGQKQRVAIVRALIMHPEILLFDEVTAALDPEMVREVLEVVLSLAKEGRTMMIVTHEMAFARAVADRVVFIDGGRIVEENSPEEFFTDPVTERAQRFLDSFKY